MSNFGRPFTSAASKKGYQERERVRAPDGTEWLSKRAAMRYLHRTESAVRNWGRRCPLLGNKPIATRKFSDAFGRETTYYSKVDLDRVRKKIRARDQVPTYPGLIHTLVAATTLQVSSATLHRLLKEYKFKAVKRRGQYANGDVCWRYYVPAKFVEAVQQDRGAATGTDRVTMREAATILGLSVAGVEGLVDRGTLTTLPGLPREIGNRLRRAAVVALKKKRDEAEVARMAVPSNWKDTATLARLHRVAVITMSGILLRWVKQGLLIRMES